MLSFILGVPTLIGVRLMAQNQNGDKNSSESSHNGNPIIGAEETHLVEDEEAEVVAESAVMVKTVAQNSATIVRNMGT